MATMVFKNAKLYVDAYDLSTDINQHSVTVNVDAVENTTFGSDSRTYLPGLMTTTHQHNGYFDSDGTNEPDDVLDGNVSLIVTVAPTTGANGEPAYITQSVRTDYSVLEGSVGDIAGFAFTGQGTGQHARGTILNTANTAVTVTGTGTAYQVGAIAATETGYAALHVVSASASDTLDVVVQSDDAEGFPSATARITFTQATAATAEWSSVAGAVTDDWWRVSHTVAGDGGESFLYVVTFGIV